MAIEFTGERVVPGQVDTDLWNEHFARYAFASRLARGKRVLDLGCGTGYGSAELSRQAATVTGLDVSADAVEFAREKFVAPGLEFVEGSATEVALADSSYDLIVAFEVIEHLKDWRKLLAEATSDDVGAVGAYIAPVEVNDGRIAPGNLREQIRVRGITFPLQLSA